MIYTFFIIISTLFHSQALDCKDINVVRELYNNIDNEEKLENFYIKIKDSDCKFFTPYLASAIMMKAQYVFSPLNKLNYFREGKNILEKYIKKNPESIDAIYVRIMVQKNIPKLLNYYSDLNTDIKFINNHISKSEIPDEIKIIILKNINS